MNTDMTGLPSPCYVLEEARLRENLQLIDRVQKASGTTIILALKGFAMWSAFPLVKEYLSGCSASSYNEARLAREHFGGHVHLYAPAYTEAEFPALLELSDRISFNTLNQWQRFSEQALNNGVSCGLRINPEIKEVETAIYNPCATQSRLGIPADELAVLPEGVEGLHVHALCECGADSTARLIEAVEERFGQLLPGLKWLNLGGGHLMTRKGYDLELLVEVLNAFKQRHPHLDVVLEPGSAIAWDVGPLVSTVLDVMHRGGVDIALLDTSATAHMPDVLEMPYRPNVRDADEPSAKAFTYRLGGMTCLAGDVIGDYAFDRELKAGDRVIFEDMIHYTMVKTTMFNGVAHPSIAILHENGEVELVRQFDYSDYERRLS
ncbi:MAG: carboxynorspermidine decarboxylase [Candidatus Thiodiazotropha sp. (ex. Lucinisca nassula)]|nr:carboxynorspermidine decarboxylase [Candidatus Thiodiazotropha sp. (ex. Lucinisca nassula)]MBW9274837.1 carboxynorspermidine decarboxylase [Candidatus Thiodiazotropha sp. (ex. Lucinisca nassula)]